MSKVHKPRMIRRACYIEVHYIEAYLSMAFMLAYLTMAFPKCIVCTIVSVLNAHFSEYILEKRLPMKVPRKPQQFCKPVSTSVAALAETSIRPPRKLFISTIKHKYTRSKFPKNKNFINKKNFTGEYVADI